MGLRVIVGHGDLQLLSKVIHKSNPIDGRTALGLMEEIASAWL